MKKHFFGFTLSEALMALTIVGIVSALTVPTLVKNYQKHTYLLSLQKVYAELQQNLTIFQTENYRNRTIYGSRLHLQTGYTIDTTAGYFLKNYYKINKDCGTTAQPCFAASYSSINNGTETAFSCSNGYSVQLPSSAAVCLIPARTSKMEKFSPTGNKIVTIKHPAVIYIDTNGAEVPNIGGRDMFTLNLYEDFSIDVVNPDAIKDGTAKADREELYNDNCLTSTTGVGCFGKILNENWKMNY